MRDNKSAFPMYEMGEPGMTLRDWFAGKALAGMLSDTDERWQNYPDIAAQTAYRLADAMLEARK